MKSKAIPMIVAVLELILVSCNAQDPPPVTGDITFFDLKRKSVKVSFPAVSGTFSEYVYTISPTIEGEELIPTSTPKGSNSTVVVLMDGLVHGTEYTFGVKTKDGSKFSATKSAKVKTTPMEVDTQSISVEILTMETAFIKWKNPHYGKVDTYKLKVSPKVPFFPASPRSEPEVLICGMAQGTHYLLEITSTYDGKDSLKTARYYFTTLKTPGNIPNFICPTAIPVTNSTYTRAGDGASSYDKALMTMGLLLVFIWIARG